MKHIMMVGHVQGIYQEIEQTLKAYYKVSPFLEDTYLQKATPYLQPDLVLLVLSDTATEGSGIGAIPEKIAEISVSPVIILDYSRRGRTPSTDDDEKEQQSLATEIEYQALESGAADYIRMPVSPALLLHRISTCLELSTFRKERPYVEKIQDAISCSFAELVECRDVTTGGHLKNTTLYFNILLREAMKNDSYSEQLRMEDTRDLLRSVTLHDIGKIGINDDVLRKESTLDFNEFEYMKTHTTLGKQAFENIIKETGGSRWLYLARDMAYCHYERWDGTGYPNGLKGEEIPLCARLLTVADVYDALTSNRAYKRAFSHEKAMEIIIEGKGSLFDPELVDLFVNVNDHFAEILNNKHDIELIEKE